MPGRPPANPGVSSKLAESRLQTGSRPACCGASEERQVFKQAGSCLDEIVGDEDGLARVRPRLRCRQVRLHGSPGPAGTRLGPT